MQHVAVRERERERFLSGGKSGKITFYWVKVDCDALCMGNIIYVYNILCSISDAFFYIAEIFIFYIERKLLSRVINFICLHESKLCIRTPSSNTIIQTLSVYEEDKCVASKDFT